MGTDKVQPIPAGYSQRRQLIFNMLRERAGPGMIVGLLTALVLIPFFVYIRRGRNIR